MLTATGIEISKSNINIKRGGAKNHEIKQIFEKGVVILPQTPIF